MAVVGIVEVEYIPQYLVRQSILVLGGHHRIGTLIAHTTQDEARLHMLLEGLEVATEISDGTDGLGDKHETVGVSPDRQTLDIAYQGSLQTRA